MGLLGLYYYLTRPVTEGIINTNCCGGIEAGVHYSETDTRPPSYVRRCFKSGDDNEGGTAYQWSGFPCSSKQGSECCDGGDKFTKGKCIATTKGGYCDGGKGNFIFNRRSEEPKQYLKHSNDNIIDINDTIDMKDYYYKRDSEANEDLSPEMKRFMKRRSKDEAYMERQVMDKRTSKIKGMKEAKNKLDDQKKNIQIVSILTCVHLLFILIFSFLLKEHIIENIQVFYDLIYGKWLTFRDATPDQ